MKIIWVVSVLFGVALCEKRNILEFFSKSCGEITCGYGQYCNDYVGTCDSCSRICDEGPNRHIVQCNQSCMGKFILRAQGKKSLEFLIYEKLNKTCYIIRKQVHLTNFFKKLSHFITEFLLLLASS